MHSFEVLRNACIEAMEIDGDPTLFHDVVDPASVLELVNIAEAAWPPDQVKALGALLNDLVDYIGQTQATPDRDALLRRAREQFGNVWI